MLHADVPAHRYTAACTFSVTYYEIKGERETPGILAFFWGGGGIVVARNLMSVLKIY